MIKKLLEQKKDFSILVKKDNELIKPLLITKNNKDINGYIVALTDNNVSLKDLNKEYKRLLIMAKYLNYKDVIIGLWKDNNQYYLDLNILVTNKFIAKILKVLFNQKAIFNLNKWRCE